jgi:16S rRNA (cytidine1402-2'-O)-methyltransferase
MAGAIYLVATPIGNLEDITLRALRVLREADLIACEDTRHTRKLLDHYQIHRPLVSYHEHNEAARAAELVERALAGAKIALVSDAGMPGISDPGYRVVALAIERGVPLAPVPGPVAAEAALAASGLPAEAFRFGGFLPSKRSQRRKLLASLADETATLVFYEAPHRILAALEDVVEVLGARPVVVARELTKAYEEFVRGTAVEALAALAGRGVIRGEITLLIGRSPGRAGADSSVRERVEQLMRDRHLDRMAALKQAARERGISKREAYREWEENRACQ